MKNFEKNIKAFSYSISPLVFSIFAFWMVYKLIIFLRSFDCYGG